MRGAAAPVPRQGHVLRLMGVLVLARCCASVVQPPSFDIRTHLGTRTSYAHAPRIPGAPHIQELPDPPGYTPVHLYLLSRHGTRWPTKKRMKQISTLEGMFHTAGAQRQHPWMAGWRSPYRDNLVAAGELHRVGEEELWALGTRMRQRFPQLLQEPYLPAKFPIVSTQVPRAVASATAFASGFFPPVNVSASSGSDWGTPPGTRPQPIALTMSPKLSDPLLRFFDVCPAFLAHEETTERWLASWMRDNWGRLGAALQRRLRLSRPLAPCLVDALYQLCQEEVGLWNETGRACALFEREELLLLEWQSDVRVVETMAWGAPVNFHMAARLLADLGDTLRGVAEGGVSPQLRARLLFAHAETVVPLATLLGLFRPAQHSMEREAAGMEGAEQVLQSHWVGEQVLQADSIEEDLPVVLAAADSDEGCVEDKGMLQAQLLPIPPGWAPRIPPTPSRWWRGAIVSPYGANLAVVLYRQTSQVPTWDEGRVQGSTGQYAHGQSQSCGDGQCRGEQDGAQLGEAGPNGTLPARSCGNRDHPPSERDHREGAAHHPIGSPSAQLESIGDGMHAGGSSAGSGCAAASATAAAAAAAGDAAGGAAAANANAAAANTAGAAAAAGGAVGGSAAAGGSEYVVRLLYNEQVVPWPGCGGELDCPLERVLQVLDESITPDKLALVTAEAPASVHVTAMLRT